MPIVTKSLREYLQGNLVDFAERCEMQNFATPQALTSLVVTLADLREEGVVLIPEIFLCDSLDETLKLLPVKEVLQIGRQKDPSKAIAEAVKKCAPLAIGGWCIYVARDTENYVFGVFRGSLGPLSIPVEQTLFTEPRETINLVRLLRTASGCIEIRNHRGDVYSMLLSDRPTTSPLPHANAKDLVSQICAHVKDDIRESTTTYLEKTVRLALNACHGAIIVALKGSRLPAFLADGVVLQRPLDVSDAVRKLRNGDTEAEHVLNANAALIKGMISSDGITVFDSSARLIAYNCFIASPNKVAGKVVIGGARTRAFEALASKVGKQLAGVFMQSQDGWTRFDGGDNVE